MSGVDREVDRESERRQLSQCVEDVLRAWRDVIATPESAD
jgi:hypothetical protein